MASIRKEIPLEAAPEKVWAAVRDFGAVHKRVAPGFLVDAKLDGNARIVTFANGTVARELLVDLDDGARRFVYAVVGGSLVQHSASVQVFPEGEGRCRLVWISDFLPNELADYIRAQVEAAARVIKPTLEAGAS